INEYTEYNHLIFGQPKDPKDIYQEFLLEEYAEFMHIIPRFRVQDPLANTFIRFFNKYSKCDDHSLPSTSQAGRAFIENLKLPNFSWRKETIFEYNRLEYITEEFIFNYKLSFDKWKNIEQNIPIGSYVIPIIFYSDATLCDHLGKTSRYPVFMILGNIPLARHNKTDAKILLGYVPNLEYNSTSEKQSAKFRSARRKLFYYMLAAMLRPLRSLNNTGVHLYINGSLKWFYPYLAFIISDWPEACLMSATYGSPSSLHPCYFCLLDHNAINNVHLEKENIIICNENTTKNFLRQGNSKQISVHHLRNALWKRPIENWLSQDIEKETISIEVFKFAYLNNDYKVAIRASSNYYRQVAFSDVCVEMDESEQDNYLTDNGLCYAKILLILRIISPKLNQKLELALVH
ncbi:32809_t:CDS:2, partial [Gigaspora margarita]